MSHPQSQIVITQELLRVVQKAVFVAILQEACPIAIICQLVAA